MPSVFFGHPLKHVVFEQGPADQIEEADDASGFISLWEPDE